MGHVGNDSLYSEQRANEVDIHYTLKFCDVHLVDRSDGSNTRIIQQHVDPTVSFYG